MPHVTKEEDFSGFVGFVVVLACRKVKTPVILVANPTTTRMMANKLCTGNTKSSDGTARCTSHMNTAITNARTGGGTFNSRLRTTADHYPALLPYHVNPCTSNPYSSSATFCFGSMYTRVG